MLEQAPFAGDKFMQVKPLSGEHNSLSTEQHNFTFSNQNILPWIRLKSHDTFVYFLHQVIFSSFKPATFCFNLKFQ